MSETVVWKYELAPGDDIRIPVGPNSRYLTAAMQFTPVLWIEHEVSGTDPVLGQEWEFLLAATGVVVPTGWEWVDMVQAMMAYQNPETEEIQPKFLVWHIYKKLAEPDKDDLSPM